MISMTSIQQLLQREPATSTAGKPTDGNFADSYAQAALSASAKDAANSQSTDTASQSSTHEKPNRENHEPTWMSLLVAQSPVDQTKSGPTSAVQTGAAQPSGQPRDSAATVAGMKAEAAQSHLRQQPSMTGQPVDPTQSDKPAAGPLTPSTELSSVTTKETAQLAPGTPAKPTAQQPTMTDQPVNPTQSDKVAAHVKSVTTAAPQLADTQSSKPGAQQPSMTEQPVKATPVDAQIAATRADAVAAQLANTRSAKVNAQQPTMTNQPLAAPQVMATKAAVQPNAAQRPTTAPNNPTVSTPELDSEHTVTTKLAAAPELMRQTPTTGSSDPLLSAQLAKEAIPVADSAKFILSEQANPNSLNATQNVAQTNQQSFVADTAGTAPQLTAKLGTQAWQQQLSQQVSQLVLQSDQSVALRLHPAELGSLMVQMKVEDGAAQLSIQSANAQVRQALEQALPQLRDALANQGIDLGQTHVGSQSARDFGQQQQRQTAGQHESASDSQFAADNTDNDPNPVAPSSAPAGTLDLYA